MIEEIDSSILEYRRNLVDIKNKLSENYDKLVITLSGGALAFSITFLKDIVVPNKIVSSYWLIFSWFCFVFSIGSVLFEILFGIEAHKTAIFQVDKGTIHESKPGGLFSSITLWLHRSSAVSLVAGLLFMGFLKIKCSSLRQI